MTPPLTRRTLLRWGTVAGVGSLAGCGDTVEPRSPETERPTDLFLELPADTRGSEVVFSGELLDRSTGDGIPDRTVTVLDRDGGLLGTDDELVGPLIDPFDTEDNPLVTGTTDSAGRFDLRWPAEQVGSSRDVEVYAAHAGSSTTLPSRFPVDGYYPVQVRDQVVPYDFFVSTIPRVDTVVEGFSLRYYVAASAVSDFMTDPSSEMPRVALEAETPSSDSVSLEPTNEQLLTSFPGYLTSAAARGYVAELSIDSSRLETGEYPLMVRGESFGITRRSPSRTFRVVDPSVSGLRRYLYDQHSKFATPVWWENVGIAQFLSQGVTDPLQYIVDHTIDLIDSIVSGESVQAIAAAQIRTVLEETILPLLGAIQKQAVGEALYRAASDAGVDSGSLAQDVFEIPSAIEDGRHTEARTSLSVIAERVSDWRAAVAGQSTAGSLARAVLDTLEILVRADLELLRSGPTSASVNVTDGTWPQEHRDRGNTGYVSAASNPAPPVREVWRFDTSGWVGTSPVIADGVVYAGDQSREESAVYAISPTNGTEMWRVELGATVFSTPAVDSSTNTLYVGLSDELVAIDVENEELRWRSDRIRVENDSALVLTDDGVLVAGRSDGVGGLFVVTAEGDVRQLSTEADPECTSAIADGTVYTVGQTRIEGELQDQFLAVDLDTGDVQWRSRWAPPAGTQTRITAVTEHDGTVYIGGETWRKGADNLIRAVDGFVRAIDVQTERQRWEFKRPGGIRSPLATDSETVYAFVAEGDAVSESNPRQGLYAIDAATGETRWEYLTPENTNPGAAFVVTDETVYFARDGVYAIDSATGEERWRVDHDTSSLGVPVVLVDGVLLVAGPDGVRALSGEND